jgi:hypothetical protein
VNEILVNLDKINGTTSRRKFLTLLEERNLNLLIIKNNKTLVESRKEGMRPLLEAVERYGRSGLRDSVLVDKIVGKAAALLMVYLKPKEVYCGTLSTRAEAVLQRHNVAYHSENIIPEILCETGDDICPFEKTVLEIETALNGYRRIMLKMLSFNARLNYVK